MTKPILVSTWSFGLRGHAVAWPALAAGGSSHHAGESACAAVDADEEIDSVGFGGLPDRDGNVTLDGAVMLAPARCGAVAAVRGHLHPVSIARRVMERTPHFMLVGPGADAFADEHGLAGAALVSDAARRRWVEWRSRPTAIDQSADAGLAPPRPVDTGAGGSLFGPTSTPATGVPGAAPVRPPADPEARWRGHDTIAVIALDCAGVLAAAGSTSGTPFKLPGRVGDTPIIGHGLFVDPEVGAAVATGTGELIMGACASFLVVERMRGGDGPLAAMHETLERIRRDWRLEPSHQVGLIAMTPGGAWRAAALRDGYKVSVTDTQGARVVTVPGIVEGSGNGVREKGSDPGV